MIWWGEEMEVYVELVYLVSLFTCIISLECTFFLLNSVIDKRKILIQSSLLSFHILVIYEDSFLSFIYWFCLFVYFYRKQVFLYFLTYMMIYLSLIYFFQSFISDSSVYKGVLLISSTTNVFLCITILFLLGMFEALILIYSKRKIGFKEYMHDFEIIHQGNTWQGKAFFDSGNDLYYEGYPIMLINKRCFHQYQKDSTITTKGVVERKIDIVKIEQININKQNIKDIYIGVIEDIEYDGLLHKQLMGGVL